MRAEVRFSAVHCAPTGNLLASSDVGDPAEQTVMGQCMFVCSQMFLLPQVVGLRGRSRCAACNAVPNNVFQLQVSNACCQTVRLKPRLLSWRQFF